MNIGIFGLGEAGSLIAADLAAAGVAILAYDPADVATPSGVVRVNKPVEVVLDADVLLAITAGKDAEIAMQQALQSIPKEAVYADLSTNSAGTKKKLAANAADYGFKFVDLALMGTVPGKGLRTPMLASGDGAKRIMELFAQLPSSITVVSDVAGDAATRKLLRSIMMKGLAATVIEALRAAEKADCAEWLWCNLVDEIKNADASLLPRLVIGTKSHALRRLHEMEASMAMLNELGVDPIMTRATVENLRRIPEEGLPEIPA